MHQPLESRKYQLFPQKDRALLAAGRRSPESETASTQAQATGQSGSGEKDRSVPGGALRTKPKEQTLIRRRKVSVPDLGPMTTVQEVAMDSRGFSSQYQRLVVLIAFLATIPGRPPLHERSISAPGNSWRQHMFGESMLSCISGPAFDENAEMGILDSENTQGEANGNYQPSHRTNSASPKRQPLSPKSLAPLVIPVTSAPQPQRLMRQTSSNRLRSGSSPPDVPPKSARMKESSPYSRGSPYTPMSSTTTLSLSTAPTSVSNTPLSALPGSGTTTPTSCALEGRSSPKPWTGPVIVPSPMGHSRGQSETTQRSGYTMGHRRGESEASIMDRGRPKKRPDGSPIKRSMSKRSASQEKKAFESLPKGIRATDAASTLPSSELETLRRQAMGQASRFEVLHAKDVESLSRVSHMLPTFISTQI